LEFEKARRFFSTLSFKSRNMSFVFSIDPTSFKPVEKNRKKDYHTRIIVLIKKVFQVLFFLSGEIMTTSMAPHTGIELDLIDFSSKNRQFPFSEHPDSEKNKIDYKEFIKTLYGNMMKNGPFLAFSTQIRDVNQILKMKYSSANDIADVILKDMALTTKLLKLVNSSFYGQFSNKSIATISEAMIILGTEEIKLAATSLKIYELMKDITNIKILKNMAIRSLQRSIIARELALGEKVKDAEAIQISAMLYGFGEYLVAFFSPKVYINIEIAIDEKKISKEQASKSVIGVSYSELGRFFSSRWNLPPSIVSAMKPISNFDLSKNKLIAEDMQRFICSFSDELCNIDFSMPGDVVGKKIHLISEKYKTCLDITPSKAVELLKMSYNKITKHASILKMP